MNINTDQATSHINFLLSSAAAMASSIHRVNSYKQNRMFDGIFKDTSKIGSISSKPLAFSFSSKHSHTIQLNDSSFARRYLGLPIEEYSVLDSSLITKSRDNSSFLFVLPLGDVFSFANFRMKNMTKSMEDGSWFDRLSLILSTPMTVTPSAAEGTINMSSGNFVFIPVVHWVQNSTGGKIFSVSGISPHIGNATEFLAKSVNVSSILPRWLIWGGESVSDVSEHELHSNLVHTSNREISFSLPPLKSSIQAGFSLQLSWDPSEENDKIRSFQDEAATILESFLDSASHNKTSTIRRRKKIKVELPMQVRIAFALTKRLYKGSNLKIATCFGYIKSKIRDYGSQLMMIQSLERFIYNYLVSMRIAFDSYEQLRQRILSERRIAEKIKMVEIMVAKLKRFILRLFAFQVIPFMGMLKLRGIMVVVGLLDACSKHLPEFRTKVICEKNICIIIDRPSFAIFICL